MSRRDRDEQSLIRVTDGAGARLHMQHTHASARTHARAGTRNMAAMTATHGHKTRATRSANPSIHTARSMRPQ